VLWGDGCCHIVGREGDHGDPGVQFVEVERPEEGDKGTNCVDECRSSKGRWVDWLVGEEDGAVVVVEKGMCSKCVWGQLSHSVGRVGS
jgi:hypothetical protein